MVHMQAGSSVPVLVKTTTPPELFDTVLDICLELTPIFARKTGFVSARLMKNRERNEILNVLVWRSMEHHEACRSDPELVSAGKGLMEMVESGRVEMEATVYEVALEMDQYLMA